MDSLGKEDPEVMFQLFEIRCYSDSGANGTELRRKVIATRVESMMTPHFLPLSNQICSH